MIMNNLFRPRRSMLYVPGCNTRYLKKAESLRVDSVILDLGDPILIEAKEQSRQNVVKFVQNNNYGNRELIIRVNDFDSPWGKDDIKAIAKLNADAILFPNIESRDDVLLAIDELDKAGGKDTPIMVMI
jgi:citrate lyase subunit beta/citryl-CoA lyase